MIPARRPPAGGSGRAAARPLPGKVCRVSIAALAMLCLTWSSSVETNAQTSPANEPARTETAPAGKPISLLDAPTFIIVDDPKRIGDLFERLDSPDFRLVRPDRAETEAAARANADSFVKSVAIKGQMSGSIANLTIRMEIQQTAAGQVWTPIGLDGVVLRSIRSDGQPAASSVVRPGGPWQVRTDSAGTHAIEVELGTEIVSDRSTRRLTLSVPEAASTELNLEVPEQVLFATTNARDSLQTRYIAPRNAYSISGLLTARNRIELRWLGQSLIRSEDKVRLDCRGQIAIRMDLDAVTTRQFWQIRPLSGIPLTLGFEMPEEETLLDMFVDGQAVRPRFEKSGTGFVTVTVDNPASLKGPNADSIAVEMVTRAAYPPTAGPASTSERVFPWRMPRWKNGEIVSGIVSLELPEKWVYVPDARPLADPVDPRDLPDRLRRSANQTAFRFSGGSLDLTFRSRRRQPPLFTDVRTIGIVRRSQVEYVSDIVIQGEIDPLREYEIELDRNARPLFVGPRDVWERYEFVGESAAGERKLRRLRLTPNRSLKAETPTTLRIRYLRRSDTADTFLACLPRLVDATGESYRTWLLPEPSIALEPAGVETGTTVRKRLPAQDAVAFSNLLEQSVGDEDKWIDPRAATELPSAFFRSANPFERDVPFRTVVRPPSLDYTQQLHLTPARDAIRIRHVFECLVEQGNFDRAIVVPGRENSIRTLRYTLTHKEATQSGNLIAEGGAFVIPLPDDLGRQFTLTLEAVRGWAERAQRDERVQQDPSGIRNFDAASFDFTISDGVRLQRSLTLEDTVDSISRPEERASGWVEIDPDESARNRSRSWAAVDSDAPWPSIRTFPLASKADSAAMPPIREIEAMFYPGPQPAMAVAYRVVPGSSDLRLERQPGWSVVSADFDGQFLDVADAGDAWAIALPVRSTPGSLRVRFRSDRRSNRIAVPLPAGESGSRRIPTTLHVAHSGIDRLIPPWRSGWKLALTEPPAGIGDFEPVANAAPSATRFATFRTDDPSRALPYNAVPIVLLFGAAVLVPLALAFLAARGKSGRGLMLPSLAVTFAAAFVAAGQLGGLWALAIAAGVLAGTAFGRRPVSRVPVPLRASEVRAPRESGFASAGSAASGTKLTDEPSTVLKRALAETPSHSTEMAVSSGSDLQVATEPDEDRWSLEIEVPESPRPAGSTVIGKSADSAR